MSETTSILPGPAPQVPDAGVPAPPEFDNESGDDRRRLLIIAGVLGVVVVVVAAYLLLKGGGGSSSDDTSGLVPRGTPASVASPPAASGPASGNGSASGGKQGDKSGGKHDAKGGAGTVLPKKSHTKLARDPFKPLVSDDTATGTGTAGTTTVVTPPADTGTVIIPGSPTSGGEPATASGTPQAIKLLRVTGTSSADFDVYYAHHKVFEFEVAAPGPTSTRGTVFDQDFALLGIQGGEVTIQFGDDTPFDLKRGVLHTL